MPEREAVTGRWSLISTMTKPDGPDKVGKLSTFNARSETAPRSFTFSNAWRRAQHCIILADSIFEPDHREETEARFQTDKPVPTRPGPTITDTVRMHSVMRDVRARNDHG